MNRSPKIEEKVLYSPYYFFIMTRYEELRRQNPSFSSNGLLEVINERWEHMKEN